MRLLVFLVPCGALLAAIFGRVIYLQASAAALCVLTAASDTKRNVLCRTCCAKQPHTASRYQAQAAAVAADAPESEHARRSTRLVSPLPAEVLPRPAVAHKGAEITQEVAE